MNISIACDHGAYALKERLKARLLEQGHHVADCGAHSAESCDYPDFAAAAARRHLVHPALMAAALELGGEEHV